MADAVLYSSLDPAGPGLDDDNSVLPIQRHYNILVPCLVTGYGAGASAKPGQGWELVHADLPTGFTLRAPDGVYYIFYKGSNVSTGAAHGVQVYMAESLSPVGIYPPTGTNVRSGDWSADSNGSETTRHWISMSNSTNPNMGWWLVARGSQVLVVRTRYAIGESVGDSITADTAQTGALFFLGNFKPYESTVPLSGPQNSVILGGYRLVATSPGSTQSMYSNALGASDIPRASVNQTPYSAAAADSRLRDPITGTVERGTLVRMSGSPGKGASSAYYRIPADLYPPPLELTPVSVYLDQLGAIGNVPGAFASHRVDKYKPSDMYALLGLGSTLAASLEQVDISGVPFHCLPTFYGTIFVTLKEEFW